jgi:hypothetical protein
VLILEVEYVAQLRLWSLHDHHLIVDIENHSQSLLSRYKGQFKYLDLNKEILHGYFDLEGIIGITYLEKHIKVFLHQNVINLMDQHHIAWKYKIYMWVSVYLLDTYVSFYIEIVCIWKRTPHTTFYGPTKRPRAYGWNRKNIANDHRAYWKIILSPMCGFGN